MNEGVILDTQQLWITAGRFNLIVLQLEEMPTDLTKKQLKSTYSILEEVIPVDQPMIYQLLTEGNDRICLHYFFPLAWSERAVWRQGPLLSVFTREWTENSALCSQTVRTTVDTVYQNVVNFFFLN